MVFVPTITVLRSKAILLALVLVSPVAGQTIGATGAPTVAPSEHDQHSFHGHGGGRGRGGAYGKTKIEERDRLLGKLRNTNICRGC
jgi:hypothetical protein